MIVRDKHGHGLRFVDAPMRRGEIERGKCIGKRVDDSTAAIGEGDPEDRRDRRAQG